MRFICLFLAASVLLCGCAGTQDIPQTVPSVPEVAAVAVSVPAVTLPPEQPPQDPVELLLNTMTTEEKVGQLFLVRRDPNTAMEDIENYHLGGFVFFARDFKNQTPESIRSLLQQYQSASAIPLLISVDEEGGTVTRVSRYPQYRSSPFPSPRTLYSMGGMEAVMARMQQQPGPKPQGVN